jgi:ribosomal protein L16 Arg81 hydroxylase
MATIEEEVKLLKTAHGRLFNQYKQLENDFNSFIVDSNQLNIKLNERLKDLQEIINNFTIPSQPKEAFKDGQFYIAVVEELVLEEKKDWNNGKWLKLLIKLKEREELFNAFILEGNKPKPGSIVLFTYKADENKLNKLKCR